MASLLSEPLFEISGQAPPPNKDFYYFSINKSEVIWRWWKITVNRNTRPGEQRTSHHDFLNDAWLQSEVRMVFGQNIVQFAKALCQGHYDYLERLPDSLLLQIMSHLELEDVGQLGRTSHRFKKVCAVQVKNTGQMYACKKLCKKRLKKKGGEKMALLEKQILEKVNSLFLVNLAYAYDTKTHLCLVMTLMNGGDLKYHIYNIGYDGKGVDKGVEMKRIIHYTAQITTGILHLHAMDIIYRDMKPENVLLDSQGQCRLSDLGLAIEIAEGKTVTQMAGTGAYMAPEILNKTPYRTSVDWWALGCSIYEMVAGYTPFKGPESKKEKVEKEEVQRRILSEEPKWEHKCFDAPTKDIIQLFLKKKIEERLGMRNNMEDPRKHEWFKTINFPRLEAGLVDPPWVPKPNVVYAKDTGDIAEFSEIKGIEFDAKDDKFFKEFSTGAVPIPWQQEMMDTGLFDELNDPNRKEGSGGLDDEKKSGTCTLL
ncbi:rhodopsin kinase grk7a-like isoform X1 [Melanotaenia boesemani]|uniref:rhodopsin kinase grk7a-like isoform X1 n=1 Tax=Melanotaenia boesemani TaxID=1250792 RepID=UPI001C045284|nr:rhodopsin kinase grk7a-like isoform X1 [Melanotaenia boesemani]XP_041848746.1 rhodopsin kinase grk7a-like isoform X1 [Melanotaenia boesemani]